MTVPTEEAAATLKLVKEDMLAKIFDFSDDRLARVLPCSSTLLELEKAKCSMFLMLAQQDSGMDQDFLVFQENEKDSLLAKKKVANKKLALYPITDKIQNLALVENAAAVKPTHSMMVGRGIAPPKLVRPFKDLDQDNMVAPFWYVKATEDPELANMRKIMVKVLNCHIQVLENTTPLEKHDELLFLKGQSHEAISVEGSAPRAKAAKKAAKNAACPKPPQQAKKPAFKRKRAD